MKGTAALEAMRRDGYAPSLVILDLDDAKLQMARDWEHHNPTIARIAPAPNDKATRADLRCVVGLTVFVQGDEPSSVHAWRYACVKANAKRVVSAVTQCVDPTPLYERFETTELSDTAGVLHG